MGPRRTGRATSSFLTGRLSSRRASGWRIKRMRVNLGEAKHVNPSMICRRNSECPPKSLSILHLSGTTSGTNRTTTWWSPQSGVTLGASSRDSTWNMSRGWDVLVIVGYCNLSQFLTQMSGPLWHLFEPIWTHQGHYGTHLNVYDWTTRKLLQKIDLGMEGVMPLEIRWQFAFESSKFCFPSWQLLLLKIFSRWQLWLLNSRQIIYLELSSGSCTTPRQLLVLSAALSSQTCSGFSKQRRWMHIPFNFIAIVFKTDKDVACFCWC